MRPLVSAVEGWPVVGAWSPWPGGDTIYAAGSWWTGPDTYAPSSAPAQALLNDSPSSFVRMYANDYDTMTRGNQATLTFPGPINTLATDRRIFALVDVVDDGGYDPGPTPWLQFMFTGAGSTAFPGSATHIGGTLWEVSGAVWSTPPDPQTEVLMRVGFGRIIDVLGVWTPGDDPEPTSAGLWPLRQRQSLIGPGSWPLRQRQNGAHSGSWALRQRQTRT